MDGLKYNQTCQLLRELTNSIGQPLLCYVLQHLSNGLYTSNSCLLKQTQCVGTHQPTKQLKHIHNFSKYIDGIVLPLQSYPYWVYSAYLPVHSFLPVFYLHVSMRPAGLQCTWLSAYLTVHLHNGLDTQRHQSPPTRVTPKQQGHISQWFSLGDWLQCETQHTAQLSINIYKLIKAWKGESKYGHIGWRPLYPGPSHAQ